MDNQESIAVIGTLETMLVALQLVVSDYKFHKVSHCQANFFFLDKNTAKLTSRLNYANLILKLCVPKWETIITLQSETMKHRGKGYMVSSLF